MIINDIFSRLDSSIKSAIEEHQKAAIVSGWTQGVKDSTQSLSGTLSPQQYNLLSDMIDKKMIELEMKSAEGARGSIKGLEKEEEEEK